jgi:hypothetical protein
MRVLAACLVGFFGLGALVTMAACSSDASKGSAGAGGASAAAGGAAKAGGTSTAGSGGAGCGFQSPGCAACLGEKCGEQENACVAIESCTTALLVDLPKCVCDPTQDPVTCIGTFVSENGDPATKLAECYTLNCEDACK